MQTSLLLNSLETCPKQASLYQKGIERESLTFNQLLQRGVDCGLVSAEEPAQAASDEVYRLARSRPIETEQFDLIGLADHCAALAEVIVWCLRTGSAWTHPTDRVSFPWEPSSWVIRGGLRRVVLCDRWDERRALQEMRDWRTLEGAIYGLPMTILAVVLGPMRDGRRHGPLTRGWLHPKNQELRFRKRDGSGFDGNWEPVWREHYHETKNDWLAAMTEDGLTTETFVIHPEIFWEPDEQDRIQEEARTALLLPQTERRSLSRCFDAIRPCEFRQPCSFFREPEIGRGFVSISLDRHPSGCLI